MKFAGNKISKTAKFVNYVYTSPHEHVSSIELPDDDREFGDIEFVETFFYDYLYKEAKDGLKKWSKDNIIKDMNKFLHELSIGKHTDFVDAVIKEYDLVPVESVQWFYDNILLPTAADVNDAEHDPAYYATMLLEDGRMFEDTDAVMDEIVYQITNINPMLYISSIVNSYIGGRQLDESDYDSIADFISNPDDYLTQKVINTAIERVFKNYSKNPNQYIKQLFFDLGGYY